MDDEKESRKFNKNDILYIYNTIKNNQMKNLIKEKYQNENNKKEINREQQIKNVRITVPINEIHRLDENLKLDTKTIEISTVLCRVIYNRKILQNANIGIISGACIYISSIIENEDISTTDISNIPKTNYTDKELNEFKNKIITKLKLNI